MSARTNRCSGVANSTATGRDVNVRAGPFPRVGAASARRCRGAYIPYPEIEWRQHRVEKVRRNISRPVPHLPEPPDAINHRMMRPEYRVESRSANHTHVARNPAVHAVMHIFDSVVKIVPVGPRQHVVDVA